MSKRCSRQIELPLNNLFRRSASSTKRTNKSYTRKTLTKSSAESIRNCTSKTLPHYESLFVLSFEETFWCPWTPKRSQVHVSWYLLKRGEDAASKRQKILLPSQEAVDTNGVWRLMTAVTISSAPYVTHISCLRAILSRVRRAILCARSSASLCSSASGTTSYVSRLPYCNLGS